MIEDLDFLDSFANEDIFPDREDLDEINPSQTLLVEQSTYMHSQHNPKRLKRKNIDAYRDFCKKIEKISKYTFVDVMEILGEDNSGNKNTLWATYPNSYKILLSFPDYPHCSFPKESSDLAISNINQRLRFGGHFYVKNFTLNLFWVECEINKMYIHIE